MKMTKTQIQKSKSSLQTVFATAASGQLSENCAIFDEVFPNVQFRLSLIKKNRIANNEDFDVKGWFEAKPDDFKIELSNMFVKSLMPSAAFYKTVVEFPSAVHSRLFTIDPLRNNEDIIAYVFNIEYKPGFTLACLK